MSLSTISAAEARNAVNRIVKENGFVRESTLETMSRRARKEVEEALLIKDEKIGASVLTLAKNLYTSKARFIFELLQNADDNQYSGGRVPSVSFSLYPDRLVLDCNEDGFTVDNLRAICDIGRSSKSTSQGYIGEKGIGFKSVFMAAYKVHIQSGNLSFSFMHRKGDSGMGMVRPMWEDTETRLAPNSTRMTLFLHKDRDAEQVTCERELIRDQFRQLEPAVLLFVRKLRRIDVAFYDDHDRQVWATRLSKRQAGESSRVILDRLVADTRDLDGVEPESHIYHVTEYMARDVAPHEGRDETARSTSGQSKIVLAFPVTAKSVPVIEQQKVFAFLPMKKMGFNFLIQADFVTQANREDVVTSSDRNKDLIRGVTDAMMVAIEQFCTHETLQYTWMRYLPRQGTHHWDPFWETLVKGIGKKLKGKRVVRTRRTGILRRIGDMRHRLAINNDCHGHPLFPDLNPEVYLANSYTSHDIGTLQSFGLRALDMSEIVAIVRQDLEESERGSRLKTLNTDHDWHSRAASLLLLPFKNNWVKRQAEVRQFNMIPLKDGSWVSANAGDIFYDSIGEVSIPTDLCLQIVDPEATKNERRVDLFNALGVRTADIAMVRSRILKLHHENKGQGISFDHSLSHLKFLYLTHESKPEEESSQKLVVYDHVNRPRKPRKYDLYILNNDPYGAQNLLTPAAMATFGASFVHPRYFEDAPGKPTGASLTWARWMHDYVGVRRNIRLLKRDGESLSGECEHIAMHQGDKFLAFLRHVWPTRGKAVTRSEGALNELKTLLILCTNGAEESLCDSYLPLQELRSVQARFSDTEIMPFLDISFSSDSSLRSEWSFLIDDVGVKFQDNLDFRMDVLFGLWCHMEGRLTTQEMSRVFDLYQYIESWCVGSKDPITISDFVSERFYREGPVLVPSSEDGLENFKWVRPQECLWEAPSNFMTKHPLKALYSLAGADVEEDNNNNALRQFLQGRLQIPNISHSHIIDELEDMSNKSPDAGTVRNLYNLLQDMCEADQGIAAGLRDSFEKSSLVYAERRGSWGWYRPSQCVWSRTTGMEGKVAINGQYAELETLFLRFLRVRHVSLTMVYDSLLDAASNGATAEQFKQLLLEFNALLRGEKKTPSPEPLLQRHILPVMSPGDSEPTLCSQETEFFIVDRDDLFAAFGDRVRCLDFPLGDVCLLKNFISWAGLEPRYMSRGVEEVSRVQSGVERPLRDPKRDMKNKAYGLLRIAAMCQSPRFHADPQAVYALLRTAEMVEVEGISSRWVIGQDNQVYEHEVSTSYLHIEEREGELKAYVPRDKCKQDKCFYHALPHRLLSWMMAPTGTTETSADSSEKTAIDVLSAILTCEIPAVPDILGMKGVPRITEVEEESPHVSEAASPPATPTRRRHMSGPSPWSPDALSEAVTPEPLFSPDNSDPRYATPLTDPGGFDDSDGYGTVALPCGRLSVVRPEGSQEEYVRLLESAIVMAKRLAWRDYSGGISTAFSGLSMEDDDVFTSTSSRYHIMDDGDRYRKIGAAGELFVFVLLSSLDPSLPSFGRENWQSTIRYLAAAHPQYTTLAGWVGSETSDIVYDDVCGVLTELLICKQHLSRSQWEGKTPRYYIEVKSTMDCCETPFYVSEGQAERMLRTTNGASGGDNQDEVYVVFRVFNLGAESTGLAIYVDPEEQRRTGKLKFITTSRYAVVPGDGF